ncbi:MAG: hypothetical protein K8S27_09285 [Candidatus Omnitrophica bacterium]|nr:hypothetical protein [Candidatus Omnitrophota bacterium]
MPGKQYGEIGSTTSTTLKLRVAILMAQYKCRAELKLSKDNFNVVEVLFADAYSCFDISGLSFIIANSHTSSNTSSMLERRIQPTSRFSSKSHNNFPPTDDLSDHCCHYFTLQQVR